MPIAGQTIGAEGTPVMGPFLTDLDRERLNLKGARDALGIQPIWTRFGRHVVGNLSTVSNSVRDFTVAVLGYHFAQRVVEIAGPGAELATFLKWEQLAAYARAEINKARGFRGTQRVWKKLESDTVVLSADARHQILSSQKLYGLWGLYTEPGRASGLFMGDPTRLTPPAQKMVDEVLLPRLTAAGFKDGRQFAELLGEDRCRIDPKGAHRRLLQAVASLLLPSFDARERDFYRTHLLYGGPQDKTQGLQCQLAELLEPRLTMDDFWWSPPLVLALAKEAGTRGDKWKELAARLRRIAIAETLLAPASVLFTHMMGCHDLTISNLEKRVRTAWGPRLRAIAVEAVSVLEAELGGGDRGAGQRWLKTAKALSAGDYQSAIRLLLAQNCAVMQTRGGAAWIEEQNRRLVVRMEDELGDLPNRGELRELWVSPYFLDALRSVAVELKRPRHG